MRIPQILECHLVSGEYDYLIKVRLPNMAAYRDMLGNILLHLPAAAESRSYVVMEEVKETAVLDLEWFNYIKKGRLKVYNVQTTFFQNTFYTHDRNTINQDALTASNPSLPHQTQAFPYQTHKQKKCTHSIECVPSLQRRNRGETINWLLEPANESNYPWK